MPDPGQDLGSVALYRGTAGPAAVAELAPRQIESDRLGGEWEPGGDSVQRRSQGRTVRFSGGQEAQATHWTDPQPRGAGEPAPESAGGSAGDPMSMGS